MPGSKVTPVPQALPVPQDLALPELQVQRATRALVAERPDLRG